MIRWFRRAALLAGLAGAMLVATGCEVYGETPLYTGADYAYADSGYYQPYYNPYPYGYANPYPYNYGYPYGYNRPYGGFGFSFSVPLYRSYPRYYYGGPRYYGGRGYYGGARGWGYSPGYRYGGPGWGGGGGGHHGHWH